MNEDHDNTEIKSTPEQRKKNISQLLGSDKAISFIVILGLIGIVLIFISTYISPPQSKDAAAKEDSNLADSSQIEEYRSIISQELGNMIASMDGAGKTKVMVTISGTVRNVYATDLDTNGRETSRKNGEDENADKQNTEKRSCIIIREKDGSEKALTVGQLMPEIKGVFILCEGGNDQKVVERIKEAVSAALDISQSHICVSKLG